MTLTGRIVQFNRERGYGFICPNNGGEDVFVHANSFGDLKHQLVTGTLVRFEVMGGGKGLKAYNVELVEEQQGRLDDDRGVDDVDGDRAASALASDDDEPYCDVLSSNEYLREVTEMMLVVTPPLLTSQVLALRSKLKDAAQHHRWVEG